MANATGKGGFKDNPKNINKNGRPKGTTSIPDLLRRIGEEDIPEELKDVLKKQFNPDDVDNMNMQEAILRTTYMYAISGKPWAVQFIADRTEGKALERIDQTTRLEPFKLIKR